MAGFFITASYGDTSVFHYYRALADELARRGHRVVLIVGGQRHDVVDRDSNPSILTWPSIRPTKWRDAVSLWSLIAEHKPECVIASFAAVNLCVLVGKLRGVTSRVAWYHSITVRAARQRALRADLQRQAHRPTRRSLRAVDPAVARGRDAHILFARPEPHQEV